MSTPHATLTPRWYSPAEVAILLGYGLSKVKAQIATGQIRSIKDGKYRRVLPAEVSRFQSDLDISGRSWSQR